MNITNPFKTNIIITEGNKKWFYAGIAVFLAAFAVLMVMAVLTISEFLP